VSQIASPSSTIVPEPHWRLGWATPEAQSQAPVGYDKFGFAYCNIDGSKVYEARRMPYNTSYGPGDIIGFLIHLPELASTLPLPTTNSISNSTNVISAASSTTGNKEEQSVHLGSFIAFYKNGEELGIAFKDINRGEYYPSVSLYFKAAVSVNFGPSFQSEPKISFADAQRYRPISDMAVLNPVENMMIKQETKSSAPENENTDSVTSDKTGASAPNDTSAGPAKILSTDANPNPDGTTSATPAFAAFITPINVPNQ